jgi:beta-glucosidase
MTDLEARVDALLARMTLAEKLDQLGGVRGMHALSPFTYRLAPYPTKSIARLGLAGLRFTDGPRGINLGRSTALPCSTARAATFDPALEERVGEVLGVEARAQGANCVGAVCINLIVFPGGGRAQECYSADPVLTGAMGAALVRGLQRHVMAVVKHYACNNIERNRFFVSVDVDEATLREIYLPHFEQCVRAGAASVMSAYNRVNGTYAGQHAHLLTRILRDDWGFAGFVMSDFFLGCRSGARALRAGLDVEMPQRFYFHPRRLRRALSRGSLDASVVDRAARRVVREKVRLGLDAPARPYPKEAVASESHRAVALEVARKGIVLLKNAGGLLPLVPSAGQRWLVIGKHAVAPCMGSPGSVSVAPPAVETPLDHLRRLAPGVEVRHLRAPSPGVAARAAQQADRVIVFTGLEGREEGEYMPGFSGGDRLRLEMPEKRERLVRAVAAANPSTVVVLTGGSAIACGGFADAVPAMLMQWYAGMMGGQAVAEILTGHMAPSGRLPVSFPRRTEDVPPLDNQSRHVRYDRFFDYFHFDQAGVRPLFPFGHGLTYTEFRYESVELSAGAEADVGAVAHVTLRNVGARDGVEVVQLYVSPDPAREDRAPKRLAAFARVALAPGETKTTDLVIPSRALSAWNEERGTWEPMAARFRVRVGSSSEDLALEVPLDPGALQA